VTYKPDKNIEMVFFYLSYNK